MYTDIKANCDKKSQVGLLKKIQKLRFSYEQFSRAIVSEKVTRIIVIALESFQLIDFESRKCVG